MDKDGIKKAEETSKKLAALEKVIKIELAASEEAALSLRRGRDGGTVGG